MLGSLLPKLNNYGSIETIRAARGMKKPRPLFYSILKVTILKFNTYIRIKINVFIKMNK